MKRFQLLLIAFMTGLFIGISFSFLLLHRYDLKNKKRKIDFFYYDNYYENINQIKDSIKKFYEIKDLKVFSKRIDSLNKFYKQYPYTPQLKIIKFDSTYYEILCWTSWYLQPKYYLDDYYLFTPDTVYKLNYKPLNIIKNEYVLNRRRIRTGD